VAEEGLEDRALLPSGDESILLVGVLDGSDDGLAGTAPQMAFYEGVETGNGAQDSAPGSSTLFVRVESGAVAFLGTTAFCWPEV